MKMLNNKLKLIALDLQFCNILNVYRCRWCNNPHSFCLDSHTMLLIKLHTHDFPTKYAISLFFPHPSASFTHAILFHWTHGSFFSFDGRLFSGCVFTKKSKQWALRIYFFEKTTGIFRFFIWYIYPSKFQTWQFQP